MISDPETIDLVSSDSDDSSSLEKSKDENSKAQNTSFMSRYYQGIENEHSTYLFEDTEFEEPKAKKPRVQPMTPLNKELLRKKKVIKAPFSNQIDVSSIRNERTTLMERDLSTVPTAFEMLGVTEEEDELNTRELANLVKPSSRDTTHLDTTLTNSSNMTAFDSEEQVASLPVSQESLETTSGDVSVLSLHPQEQFSIIDLRSDSDSSDVVESSEGSEEEDDRLKGMIQRYVEHCSQYSQEPQEQVSSDTSEDNDDDHLFGELPSKTKEVVDERKELKQGIKHMPFHDPNRISSSEIEKIMNAIPSHVKLPEDEDDKKQVGNPPNTHSLYKEVASPPRQNSYSSKTNRIEDELLSPPNSQPMSQSSSRHRTLLVALEEELAHSETGQTILNSIRTQYVIGPYIRSPVHGVCLVMRQVDDEYVLIRDCITLVIDGNAMISLIKKNGLQGGLKVIRSYREKLLSDDKQKMFLILTNMQGVIAEQRKKRRESILPFTHDLVTELYIRLRDCNVSCFPCESQAAVSEWMLKILQCIRDAPYRKQLSELGVIARGRGLGAAQLKESATESESVLYRMLQCVPGVSATKAASLLEHYHSVQELLDAFDREKDEKDRETMLRDKLGGSSKQWVLARRIYQCFTSVSPSLEIV